MYVVIIESIFLKSPSYWTLRGVMLKAPLVSQEGDSVGSTYQSYPKWLAPWTKGTPACQLQAIPGIVGE